MATASGAIASAAPSEIPPPGTPYIPPQCYTKTKDADGRVHNPCFTCHVETAPPNYIGDEALQLAYSFGPPARVNPWTNLFVNRTAAVDAISDAEISTYVRRDNYHGSAGVPGLAARLEASASKWDRDGDGRWSGWLPDVAFELDDAGFDRTREGSYTGWRAYSYFPVPGGFWPTNGSFGDAMIRLPAAFREDAPGHFDRRVYAVNLAILEALIVRRDVAIDAVDERTLGQDLDGNGAMGEARLVKYRWKPGGGGMSWVGQAAALQAQGKVWLLPGLFPEGTEIAHSLRYLDVEDGHVRPAARMKELRYMVKTRFMTYGELERQAIREATEKASSPRKRRLMLGSSERGIGNESGWRLQGFIEDAEGELRPQTLEEHAFCIGCHSGVGVTDDSVFSFGRKLTADAFQRGWFHPSQRGLAGVAEPTRADGRGEYTHYLEANGAGDELRANDEVQARFFEATGKVKPEMAARVKADVTALLIPSAERALRLDKAYRVIVREQSFAHGRDATVTPAVNVHRELPEDEELATGVEEAVLDRRRTNPTNQPAQAAARAGRTASKSRAP